MWGYEDLSWMGFGLHGAGTLLFWGVVAFASVALARTAVAKSRPLPMRREENPPGAPRTFETRGSLSPHGLQSRR